MNNIGSGFSGGFKDLAEQEAHVKNKTADLLNQKDISTEQMNNLKAELHALEKKAGLRSAVEDVIHRIIMSIISSMKH